jgi:hypothetical protein
VSAGSLLVPGVLVAGHQVASGAGASPYPAGTITMQAPLFAALGLDLSACFPGTLNISIHPRTFALAAPSHTFRSVRWTELHPPEDFSFAPCAVIAAGQRHPGWIYYPHPATKARHFQPPSTLEVLAPPIPGLGYGAGVTLGVDPRQVEIKA